MTTRRWIAVAASVLLGGVAMAQDGQRPELPVWARSPPAPSVKPPPPEIVPGMPFLDVMLQDREELYRLHARFEPPLDVDMAGEKGTVKFISSGNDVSYAVLARPKDLQRPCDHNWNRVLAEMQDRLGAPKYVSIRPSRIWSAYWDDPGISVRCNDGRGGDSSGFGGLSVRRGYRYPGSERNELRLSVPAPLLLPPFEELLLKDPEEFLSMDTPRLHGRTVDLAGIPARVVAEWFGDGDVIWVTVAPARGAVEACEPVWGRIVARLSERLGTPEIPQRGPLWVDGHRIGRLHTLLDQGERVAYWHHHEHGVAATARCHEWKDAEGNISSVSLSVTQHGF